MRVCKSKRSPLIRRTDYGDLVGKKVKFVPDHHTQLEPQPVYGFVRWVHPKGRFVLVEYLAGKNGCYLRECLLLPEMLELICK